LREIVKKFLNIWQFRTSSYYKVKLRDKIKKKGVFVFRDEGFWDSRLVMIMGSQKYMAMRKVKLAEIKRFYRNLKLCSVKV